MTHVFSGVQAAMKGLLSPDSGGQPAPSPAAPSTPQAGPRSTCWSAIVRAQGSGEDARAALDELIRRYQGAVVAMIRSMRPPRGFDEDPNDLKQAFFTRFLDRDDVKRLDRERGRFRGWLRTAVRHFMLNEWERWATEKSGNRLRDPRPFQTAHWASPDRAFERKFAEETLQCALGRLREGAAGSVEFDRLLRFLPGRELDITGLGELAAELGTTRNVLAVRIHRMRRQYTQILHEVVADTLDTDSASPEGQAAIAAEMHALCETLCDPPRTHPVAVLENP